MTAARACALGFVLVSVTRALGNVHAGTLPPNGSVHIVVQKSRHLGLVPWHQVPVPVVRVATPACPCKC